MIRFALSKGKDISQNERKTNAPKAHSTQTIKIGLGGMTYAIHSNQEFHPNLNLGPHHLHNHHNHQVPYMCQEYSCDNLDTLPSV